MSVIIRLQNLPWTANALDIRRFFSGLSIPDGGVHIVGGEKGDAFIAFSTDEDARRAMLMDNGRLASNVLKLFLSSKTEMQNVIAVARGVPTSASSGPPPASQSQQGYSTSQGPPPVAGGPPPMNPRYGPQGGQQGYPNQGPPFGGPPMGPPPGGPGGSLNVAAPDPRPGMAPPYGSQPSQGMPPQMGQGRPGERPMWDGPPPSSQGNMPMEYGRRENIPPPVEMDRGRDLPPQGMGPQGGYDRNMPPRDVGPNQGYHDSGMGPMNGSQQMMDRPPQGPPPHEYRDDPRDFRDNYEYRDHSPGRDRNRYEPESSYDRRDGRKRGYGGGSPYVFASNMPQDINYKDVRKFFTGYEIPRDGLKLINDRKGRRVGDAYVRFSSPDMADEALKLDGWSMGDRTVRVEMATAEEFERAIDSYVPGTSPEREPRNDSRIAYESYDRGGNMNYGRGDVNYDRAGPVRHEPPMKRKRSLSPSEVRKGDSCCVVVKNLPFKIEKRDLFKFFTGLKFAKGDTSVHIEVGPDGRPKGIALIEFLSDKDVHRALSYHRKASLGGRLIEVISIPVDEYRTRAAKYIKAENKDAGAAKEHISSRKRDEIKIIETKGTKDSKDTSKADTKKIETKGTDQNKDKEAATKDAKKREETETKKPRNESKKEVSTDEKRYYCVELKGVPFSTKNDTIRDFFSGLQIAQRGIHIVFKPDGTAAGPAFVEFITSDDCKKALKRDKEYIGKRYIDVKPITKKEMLEELAQHQAKFSQSSHRQNGPPGPGSGSSVAQKVGRPGCVVSVQNMHFSSTLEDILDFFRGFHPIANSVKMRYNQDGLPTGDAMVAFHNREDADRATSELNRSKMRNRIVSVYLA